MRAGPSARPLIIQPDTARYRRTAWLALPGVLLGVGETLVSLAAGEGTSAGLGWLALPAVFVLFVVPALLLAGWLLLRARNESVTWEAGSVSFTNWRRRQWTVTEPTSVETFLVEGRSGGNNANRVVISGADGEWLDLVPDRYPDGRLDRIIARTGLSVQHGGVLSIRQAQQRYPGLKLPLFTRHPWPMTILWTVLIIGYIAAVINIMARL